MISDCDNFKIIKLYNQRTNIKKEEYTTNNEILDGFKKDCKLRGFTQQTTHNNVQIAKIYLKIVGENYFSTNMMYNDFKSGLLNLKLYCDLKNHSHSTKDNYFSAVSALFSYLTDCGLVTINPTLEFRKRYLTPYKVQHEQRQLVSTKELEHII